MSKLLRALALLAFLGAGCPVGTPAPPGGSSAGGGNSSGGGSSSGGAGDGGNGLGIFARLPGLWSGQAGSTPLGSFPLLNMDVRAADSNWLFCRADVDPQDSLRYGFYVESLGGSDTLVFRNGGYFQGVLRDSTTVLMDADEGAGTYHFCAPEPTCLYVDGGCIPQVGGCGFIDALFTFSSPTQLVFNAHVNGQEHEVWTATRVEARQTPSPFPAAAPLDPDAGWPELPQLSVDVTWSTALASATNVWVVLSTTPCASASSTSFSCNFSRAISVQVPAGSTSAALLFDQILPGDYYAVALLDLAGGFGVSSQTPGPGDGVSDPSTSTTVPESGQGSATLPIVYFLP